tara:strand:+ start:371 stop:553 length:183 start_codon:yes stop_codon:yes gene_type:complete
MKTVLVIVLAYVGFQVLSVVHDKYLPKDFVPTAVDKVVEIGGDTVDALSLVYEMHAVGDD